MKEVSQATRVDQRVLDERELSDAVLAICHKVLNLILTDSEIYTDLADKFEPALGDIVAVEIAPLDVKFGSFKVDAGKLTLNEADAARLISYVIEDMRQQVTHDPASLSELDIRATLEDTLALFALHELRHRTQGVEDYATVQLLKKVIGRDQLAKFDIQADRDAACALAAARAGSIESEEFLDHYQSALYYSVEYFFKIYPANADRPDKVCRVAALLFMLARLQLYRVMGQLNNGNVRTALAVRFGEDRRSLAVFEGDPQNRLLRVAGDQPEVPLLMADIESGHLTSALGRALSVTIAIGLD